MIRCLSFVLSALGASYTAATLYAQSPAPIAFPPVTLSSTETLQVNLMSASSEYPGWNTLWPCQAVVTFHASDGSVIGKPATFTIAGDARGFSATLPGASTGLQGSPAGVTASLALTPGGGAFSSLTPPTPDCALVFSMEIVDSATGSTHAILAGRSEQGSSVFTSFGEISALPCMAPGDLCNLRYAFEPTPSRIIAIPPAGLSSGETLRLDLRDASESDAAGCAVSVTFFGADGIAVGKPATFTLDHTPRTFSALLPYAALGTSAPRPGVSGQLSLTPLAAATGSRPASPPCITSFSQKILDTATGALHAYLPGQSGPDTVVESPAVNGHERPKRLTPGR